MNNPIDAFTINSAREFHRLTTGSREPQKKPSQPSSNNKPSSSLNDQTTIATTKTTISATATTSITHNPHTCNKCQHCDQIIIPSPMSSYPIIDTPSITINKEWFILTQHKPILNALELENFEKILNGLPLPEMIFGNNKIEIKHEKFHIIFNSLDALKLIDLNIDPKNLLKVSYSNDWFKSRCQSTNNTEIFKPFDWTYTSTYKGTTLVGNQLWHRDDSISIPIDKLTSKNPIKFFDEMILYEDELGDNGISILNIKIRVMSDCMLLLQRLFMRVDDVIIKIIDTRLYIDFDNNKIIREQKFFQDDYDHILSKLRGNDPKKWLRDVNWCVKNLTQINKISEFINL